MQYDLVIQLGSQVMYVHPEDQHRCRHVDGYALAPHTRMRTEASAMVIKNGIAPKLMIAGGSNFGVRYDDTKIFGADHPTQKKATFTFEAFANSDWTRKAEATVIKSSLVYEYGLKPDQILAETLSSTTKENAAFVAIILQRKPDPKSPTGILGVNVGTEKIGILTLLYDMVRAFPDFTDAGLNVKPVFAENVLANHDSAEIDRICEYYATPKGNKQYDVGRIRQLLSENRSLAEMMD